MAKKDDNNHEEEELDPLDREDVEEEESESEDEGEKIEEEELSDNEEESESDQEDELLSKEDKEEIRQSSDEEPIDLDESASDSPRGEAGRPSRDGSDGDGDPGLEEKKPGEFKTSWEEEGEDLYNSSGERISSSAYVRDVPEKDQKEHTLDDLALEGEDLPTGVEPSKPKSFNMDTEEDDLKSVPPISSNINRSNLYTNRRPKNRKGLNTLLLLVIALLVIGGSIYLLKGKFSGQKGGPSYNNPVVSSSTPEPTPIPTPVFDRSVFTVRVLNGTTKSGLAASVSAKLKSLGYQTDKTGNATNSAFLRSVVRVKDNDASLSAQLVKDLSPDFSADTSTPLKSADNADAEVILGQQ